MANAADFGAIARTLSIASVVSIERKMSDASSAGIILSMEPAAPAGRPSMIVTRVDLLTPEITRNASSASILPIAAAMHA